LTSVSSSSACFSFASRSSRSIANKVSYGSNVFLLALGRIYNRFMGNYRGPFLTSPLAPRGEICPLGVKFTPSFTPRGVHSLLFRRMEGWTENFTPRG
jgi:hypothetical protein